MSATNPFDDILSQQRAEKDRLDAETLQQKQDLERRHEVFQRFWDVRYFSSDTLPAGADIALEFSRCLVALARLLSDRGELEPLLERLTNDQHGEVGKERGARLFVAKVMTEASKGQEEAVANGLRQLEGLPICGSVHEWLHRDLEQLWRTPAAQPASPEEAIPQAESFGALADASAIKELTALAVGLSNDAGSPPRTTPMAASDLARCLGMGENVVEVFLRRYRKRYPDCYIENESKRKNEAHYLYRTVDVWPVLLQYRNKRQLTDKMTDE